jgi:predicted amidohydrolase YtcJ
MSNPIRGVRQAIVIIPHKKYWEINMSNYRRKLFINMSNYRRILFAVMSLAAMPSIAASPDDPPDAIYFNGKIVTLDAAGSIASAVAVKDGKFTSVGTTEDIRKLAGKSTKLEDLGGRLVVPGFIDAHTHPMETIAMKENWVDARFPRTASVSQVLTKIKDRLSHTPKGGWAFIACSSASQNKFKEKRLPTKAELDAIAPDNPVALANGTHMFVVNSAALRLLGVTKDTVALKGGGRALLGDDGEPNGVLADGGAALPATPTVDELKRYYAKDIPTFWNAYGYASVLAITPAAALPALQAVAETTRPDIRYTVAVWTGLNGEGMPEKLDAFKMPPGADPAYYRFGGVKIWQDGDNPVRTGLMYEPYEGHLPTDPPGGRGEQRALLQVAQHFVDIAADNGVMVMSHCSGDQATDLCLSVFEHGAATRAAPAMMRIEHFGMFQLSQTQLQRAAALKSQARFAISIQPAWLLNLANADIENMGKERASTGFRFRSMIDAGLEPAASTDMTGIYLENINPFLGIYAAVTRNSDSGVFEPKEAVSVIDALKMWTLWAAKSMGEEGLKGSIETGKYADMVVLSDDILTMHAEKLKDVRVLKTIVGGRVVYERSWRGAP